MWSMTLLPKRLCCQASMLKTSPNRTGSSMTNVKTSGVELGVSGNITPIEEGVFH